MLILYSGKERGEKLVIEFELLISIVDKGGLLQTFRDRETGKRGIRKRDTVIRIPLWGVCYTP